MFSFALNNTSLQEAAPGWYQLSGFTYLHFVRLRVDVEATFFAAQGSIPFPLIVNTLCHLLHVL